MNRRLTFLLGLALAALAPLPGTTIEPESWYRAVTAQDKPTGWSDENWQFYVNGIRNLPDTTVETNSVVRVSPKIQGKSLLEYLDPKTVFNQFLPARLVSAEKIPSPGEEAKAELDAKLKAQASQGNGPLTEADMKGKPVYYAGSPEAEAQMRQSAKEQDKAVEKFKKSGAPGNGPISGEGLIGKPVKNTGAFDEDFPKDGGGKAKSAPAADFPEEEDKRPLSQRIMNTGKKPAPAAAVAPAAQADDEADEPPLAASGSKFSKPKTGQGTKKDDTLFKNQNQNSSGQFMAPDNFIAIWAHPQDRGTGAEQDRLVLVELTDSPKPVGLTLWQAKSRKYVPQDFKYSSLRVFPQ